MNVLDKMINQLKFNSDLTFLKDHKRKLSFKEFQSFALYASTQLRSLDVTQNDLILLDIKDPFYFAAYTFACLHLKLKPAFLNSHFKKNQIDDLLKDNVYSSFVTDQSHPELKTMFIDSKAPFQFEEGVLNINIDSELIFFTSGSIQSKACILTLKNFFFSALGSTENIPFTEKDSWGLCLPLFHVGGFSILIRSVLANGSVSLIDPSKNLIEQIDDLKISHISLVSTQFLKFLEQYKNTLHLKCILLGGSAIPETALLKAIELGLPIYKSYGMTEMASQICASKQLNSKDQMALSGYLLNYRELRISEKQIYVKGSCLFKGYLKNNQLVQATDAEGWFFTKDFGEMDNEQIHVHGRSDRIFQSAGENISPELIEQELLKVPGVLRAYVCPEHDEIYGYRAIAYIEKREDLENESIYTQLEAKLSGLYRPKALRPWGESPKISWKQ